MRDSNRRVVTVAAMMMVVAARVEKKMILCFLDFRLKCFIDIL